MKAKRYLQQIQKLDNYIKRLKAEADEYERLAGSIPGQNFDRERFLEEVLMPISRGESIKVRRYDCKAHVICAPIEHLPKRLTIIEGAYSMHPDLAPYYDASVFIRIDEDTQRERILKRITPEIANRFFNEWIPMENAYFEHYKVKNNCSILIDGATIDLRIKE